MSHKDLAEFCANCSQRFQLNSQNEKIIVHKIACTVNVPDPIEGSTKVLRKSLQVHSAFSTLYKIGNLIGKEDDSIGICSKCALALTLLYKYYEEFEQLTDQFSYLSGKIKKFDSLISGRQKSSEHSTPLNDDDIDDDDGEPFDTASLDWEEESSDTPTNQFDIMLDHGYSSRPTNIVISKPREILTDTYSRLNSNTQNIPSSSSSQIPPASSNISKETEKPWEDKFSISCPNCKKKFIYEKYLEAHKEICLKPKEVEAPQNELTNLISDIHSYALPRPSSSSNSTSIPSSASPLTPTPVENSENVTEKPSQIYTCHYCDEEIDFDSHPALAQHWAVDHDSRKPYRCSSCQMNFYTRNGLQDHKNPIPKPKKKYIRKSRKRLEPPNLTCQKCSRTLSTIYQYNNHMLGHGVEHYQCLMCSKKFLTKLSITSHLKLQHGEKENSAAILQIPESPIDFHLPREPTVYKCGICEKVLKSSEWVTKHEMQHHPNKCHHCPFRFEKEETGFDHLRNCPGLAPPAHSCEECGKKFRRKNGLNRHMTMQHSGVRPYTCEICGLSFAFQNYLNRHIKLHEKKRPFKCPHEGCTQTYVNGTALKYHLNKHAGIKPALCPICGMGFSHPDILKWHMNKHNGIFPFECSHCDQKFVCKPFLKSHMKQKHEEKRFTCSLCDRKYISKYQLDAHIKKHEDNSKHYNPKKCSICDATFHHHAMVWKHEREKHQIFKRWKWKNRNGEEKERQSRQRQKTIVVEVESGSEPD